MTEEEKLIFLARLKKISDLLRDISQKIDTLREEINSR